MGIWDFGNETLENLYLIRYHVNELDRLNTPSYVAGWDHEHDDMERELKLEIKRREEIIRREIG